MKDKHSKVTFLNAEIDECEHVNDREGYDMVPRDVINELKHQRVIAMRPLSTVSSLSSHRLESRMRYMTSFRMGKLIAFTTKGPRG